MLKLLNSNPKDLPVYWPALACAPGCCSEAQKKGHPNGAALFLCCLVGRRQLKWMDNLLILNGSGGFDLSMCPHLCPQRWKVCRYGRQVLTGSGLFIVPALPMARSTKTPMLSACEPQSFIVMWTPNHTKTGLGAALRLRWGYEVPL